MPVVTPFDKLQDEVGKWGKQTFPNSTIESIRKHLEEEEIELDAAIDDYLSTIAKDEDAMNDDVQQEMADCVLIMLHLAHRMGFSLESAMRAKFAVCQARTWDSGEDRGYSKHVPPAVQGVPVAKARDTGWMF